MSGTSFDGVHASFIQTDGNRVYKIGKGSYAPYKKNIRSNIKTLLKTPNEVNLELMLSTANEITKAHAQVVLKAVKANKLKSVDLIGFHGQTIYHNGKTKHTLQIGNAPLLEHLTKIKVVTDFRRQDIAHGGSGAPLVPIYHKILCQTLAKPIVVLNIGGVANITYIDSNGKIIAFDVGPGCALIDDFVFKALKKPYDDGGKIASIGKIHEDLVKQFIAKNKFFSQKPPKSLDRNQFISIGDKLKHLSCEDSLATLTFLTATGILLSQRFLPKKPKQWIVCGGGRHNKFLIKLLADQLPIKLIEDVKMLDGATLDGDFIEAQAFGVLAARSYFGMPLS